MAASSPEPKKTSLASLLDRRRNDPFFVVMMRCPDCGHHRYFSVTARADGSRLWACTAAHAWYAGMFDVPVALAQDEVYCV